MVACRRDSFITHRAFCDALAQESARLPTSLSTLGSHLYGPNTMALGLTNLQDHHQSTTHHPSADLLRLGAATGPGPAQFNHHGLLTTNPSSSTSSSFRHPSSSPFFLSNSNQHLINNDVDLQAKPFHGSLMQLPDGSSAAANLFNLGFFSNGNNSSMHDQSNEQAAASLFAGNMMNVNDHHGTIFNQESVNHHHHLAQMSATALLQKAAQMGSTTSGGNGGNNASAAASLMRGFGSSSSSSNSKNIIRTQMADNETHLQDLMNSLANGSAGIFGGDQQDQGVVAGVGFGGFNPGLCNIDLEAKFQHHGSSTSSLLNADGLTRDFLGVGGLQARGMAGGGFDNLGSLDSEKKSATSSASTRSFAGGSLQ